MTENKTTDITTLRGALPAEPSRGSVRRHAFAVSCLAGVVMGLLAWNDVTHWSTLLVPGGVMLGSLAIHASGRTVDLNAWMRSAVKIVEAWKQ